MLGHRDSGPPIEIIEVFDVGAGGGDPLHPPPPPPPEPAGRRWTIVAVVALCAVVGTALLWPDTAKHPPAAATTVAERTGDRGGAAADVRVVADAPPGFALVAADEARQPTVDGVVGVWRPPFASFKEEGTWTMIQVRADPAPVLIGQRRVQLGDRIGILGTDRGVASLQFPTRDGKTIQMWARTADPLRLAALAPWIQVADGEIRYPGYSLNQGSYALLVDRLESGGAIDWFGEDVRSMTFAQQATSSYVHVTIADERIGAARTALFGFLLHDTLRLTDGTEARFGPAGGEPQATLLLFEHDRHTVAVTGNVEIDALARVANSVRTARPGEWDTLVATAQANRALTQIVFDGGTLTGDGTLTDGSAWNVVTHVDTTRQHVTFTRATGSAPDGSAGPLEGPTTIDMPAQPVITVAADARATYLLGAMPSPPAGAVLRVTLDGAATPVDVALTAVTADPPLAGASLAFSEPSGWTAKIVAADGQVLASASSAAAEG